MCGLSLPWIGITILVGLHLQHVHYQQVEGQLDFLEDGDEVGGLVVLHGSLAALGQLGTGQCGSMVAVPLRLYYTT